jgi:hypothetical protein
MWTSCRWPMMLAHVHKPNATDAGCELTVATAGTAYLVRQFAVLMTARCVSDAQITATWQMWLQACVLWLQACMLWLQAAHPDRILLHLHELPEQDFAGRPGNAIKHH